MGIDMLTRRVAASFGTGFAPSELVNSASPISTYTELSGF